MIVTGYKTKQGYKMHAPEFPYFTTHYIGYSLEDMKRKYRQDHGLKYERIEWVIVQREALEKLP